VVSSQLLAVRDEWSLAVCRVAAIRILPGLLRPGPPFENEPRRVSDARTGTNGHGPIGMLHHASHSRSGVADATRIRGRPSPALKGRAKFELPLRGISQLTTDH
jgi:hypothetical protein